jgi:hypothetical protein
MTSLFVDHTDAWIIADLDVDPVVWSGDVVRQRAEQENLSLRPEQVELLAAVMVPALEFAQAEDPPPVMVLFLHPIADEPMVASVKIRAEAIDEALTLEEIADELRMPAEMLEQPAVQETVRTRSGEALHLIQRYREPIDAEFEQIQEHEVFAWILPDYDGPMLVTMSTSYVDLLAAAEWRPALTALASTLIMKPEPDDPPRDG